MRKIKILLLSVIILFFGIGFLSLLARTAELGANPGRAVHLPLPEGDAPWGSFRFVAFGDTGTGDEIQYAVARRIESFRESRPFDTVLMLGDNIYPDGNPVHFTAKFERPYAELLESGVKFYASLGNHDVRRGREAQINYSKFNMNGRPYYSFVRGDGLVEFFALDSTNYDAAQAQWIESALAASTADWKIAFFHHPIYSSAYTHGSDVRLRNRLEPIFVKYRLNAAFSGHDHTYERIKPQQGIQYFVSGTGGKLRTRDLNRRGPYFAAGNDESNGFMFVELNKDELCYWYVDAKGIVIDSGKLEKYPTGQ